MKRIQHTQIRDSAIRLALAGFLAMVVWVGVGGGHLAHAATITVTTTADVNADDGLCSLREAITAANTDVETGGCPAGSGADEIIAPAGVYGLSRAGISTENENLTGDLDVRAAVTITGAGASTTIIDAHAIDRVMHIVSGSATVFGLTFTDGRALREGSGEDFRGGGIKNDGGLLLRNVAVRGNVALSNCVRNPCPLPANQFTASGGGIYNDGTLTIIDSAISENRAAIFGGGIYDSGHLSIHGSTISDNVVSWTFTTIDNETHTFGIGGGIAQSLDPEIANSTISGNVAALADGGISEFSASLTNATIVRNSPGGINGGSSTALSNSIVADNAGGNCSRAVSSQGYNISSDASCGLSGSGDMQNTDPRLGPLADNGGPTKTHALLLGSPAIDAGNPAAPGSGGSVCEATDQRGEPRPQDGDGNLSAVCDIGSFEVASDMLPVPGDMEGDDVPDAVDNCPTVQNTGQADGDVDMVGDVCDNCPSLSNNGQGNADGDPPGDACDNCPTTFNPGQQNNVHPGTPAGDHCEDPEPDGVFDISDNCPDTANGDQENTDASLAAAGASVTGDAVGDACDDDDDNDSGGALANRATGPCAGTGVPVFDDCAEAYLGTNPLDNCALGPGTGGDAWPADLSGPTPGVPNGFSDTADIAVLTGNFGKVVPTRADLTTNGSIDTADIAILTGLFGDRCT